MAKLKEGDKVRITYMQTFNEDFVSEGDVATVESVDMDFDTFQVITLKSDKWTDAGGWEQSAVSDHVELIEE